MHRKWAGSVAIALLLPASAMANEAKEGWGFQFRQDTFDKTLFPIAIMSEETKAFDKATMFVACAKDGSLLVAYSPSRMISFDTSVRVEFRGSEGTKEYTFSTIDIPHIGTFFGLPKTESAALINVFTKADGEVPFRGSSKQGTFTSIGAEKTFDIVRKNCPK